MVERPTTASPEKGRTNPKVSLHLVRHGETKNYGLPYDREVIPQHALTSSGATEALKTAAELQSLVMEGDTVIVLHSQTPRTMKTAHVIVDSLKARSFAITNPKAGTDELIPSSTEGLVIIDSTTELNEVGNFNFDIFKLLVFGGDIPESLREEGKDTDIDIDIFNPKRESPQDYYRNSSWLSLADGAFESLPIKLQEYFNNMEPYELTEVRITRLLQKISKYTKLKRQIDGNDLEASGGQGISRGNLHIILVTHDTLTMAIAEIATNNHISCFNTGAALSMELSQQSNDAQQLLLAIAAVNLTDLDKNPITEVNVEVNILASLQKRVSEHLAKHTTLTHIRHDEITDQEREYLWRILEPDLKHNILAATNLGIFTPNLEHEDVSKRPQWIVLSRRGKNAVAFVYKGYRFYLSGDQELVQELVDRLAEGDPIPLPDSCTFVAPRSVMALPEGFGRHKERQTHSRTTEETDNYERRLFLERSVGYLTEGDLVIPEVTKPTGDIRQLTQNDISLIHNLFTVPDDWDGGDYSDEVFFYENRLLGGLPYFGIFDDGNLVGIVGTIGTQGLFPDGGIAAIGDIFVLHNERNKGYGSWLTYELLRHLVNNFNLNIISADIRYDKPTRVLFEKLGFHEITHDKSKGTAGHDRQAYLTQLNEIIVEYGLANLSPDELVQAANFTPGNDMIRITQLFRKKKK